MEKILIAHAPRPLVEELIGRGHELIVAHYPGEWPADQLGVSRCRFLPFPHRQKADPRAIHAMRRMVCEHRPQVIHAFSPRSLAATVLATIGIRPRPRILSYRGISTPPRWVDPADLISYLAPSVTAHACESEAVADAMVRAGIRRESCHVVYNCIDAEAIAGQDRRGVRDRFGIPPDAFLIGTTATVRPVKGIDLLLRAALDCLDRQDLHVIVIGPVSDRRVVRLSRDRNWGGRLHLPGFVPCGGALAAGFDVFVMPSRREALCRALIEAMSLGTCPVVSDAGGMKELVRHGREGMVVPREDVAALGSAIRELHDRRDLVRSYGQAAAERVRGMCTPAAMADKLERLYASGPEGMPAN